MADKKTLMCTGCGKKTQHTQREARATFYDRRGQPETNTITIYTCDVCGRIAGT